MEGMSKEQFRRKYFDTHRGIHSVGDLANGGFGKSSLVKKSPGDKNIRRRGKIPGKNLIENKCMKDRAEVFKHYLMDATDVRSQEILDPDKLPIDKLLSLVIKTLPQKVEGEVEHAFTFADMAKKAAMERAETIDVENESKQ